MSFALSFVLDRFEPVFDFAKSELEESGDEKGCSYPLFHVFGALPHRCDGGG
jgi:hypothetical protein